MRSITKSIIALALCSMFSSTAHANDVQVFPPIGCVAGQAMMLTWDDQHNVMCNPIPTCTANQTITVQNVEVNGVARIYIACVNIAPQPPVCTGSGWLQFDGTKYVCNNSTATVPGNTNTDNQHDNGQQLSEQPCDR